MKLSNKTFDWLKWICTVCLPALTTLYGVIGNVLNIPYTQEVLTIAAAVIACMGTMLGISSIQYHNGEKAI